MGKIYGQIESASMGCYSVFSMQFYGETLQFAHEYTQCNDYHYDNDYNSNVFAAIACTQTAKLPKTCANKSSSSMHLQPFWQLLTLAI